METPTTMHISMKEYVTLHDILEPNKKTANYGLF